MFSGKRFVNVLPPGGLSGIPGSLRASLEPWIPLGYQDETGFHYGIAFISSLLELSPEKRIDPLLP